MLTCLKRWECLLEVVPIWKPVLPPLVTLWVYEFKPQAETLSVELHRDAGLISEVATANARAFKQ